MRSIDEVIKETATENVQVNSNSYQIERKEASDSACIFFAFQTGNNQTVVIKVLKDFRDSRYKLDTVRGRQQCQLEALRMNQKFTNNVYQGMGSIYTDNGKHIWDCDKSDIIHINTTYTDASYIEKHLKPDMEYALIMGRLPENSRLDLLVAAGIRRQYIKPLLRALVSRIVRLHQDDISRPLSLNECDDNGYIWGSPEQIRSKLEQNLRFFDKVGAEDKSLYDHYSWLKSALCDAVDTSRFRSYLEERLHKQQIKHCHGDLKTNNIWLEYIKGSDHTKHPVKVSILDAIDFNANYSHIDVLSDIAMLAVDIEAYSEQQWMLLYLLDCYYKQTGLTNDSAAKTLLTYYIAEKAIVRAMVSICCDRSYGNVPPNIEQRFLAIAAHNTTLLKEQLHYRKQLDYQKVWHIFFQSPARKPCTTPMPLE